MTPSPPGGERRQVRAFAAEADGSHGRSTNVCGGTGYRTWDEAMEAAYAPARGAR
jgi:hypothetical protein